MTGKQAAILGSRAVVAVSGDQARDFLQGLVTSDIDKLRPGEARNAALLTPQGKILHEFILYAEDPDGFLLETPAELAQDLARRLMFYRLRARVDIAVADGLAVVAIWGEGQQPSVSGAFADPRLAGLGWRAIIAKDATESALEGCDIVAEPDYHAHRIALGVAELGQDYGSGEVFPHEADLDQLGGVDFHKGCFIGQEVVSRMQHRGTARSRFVPVEVDGAAPEPGTAVEAGGKAVGTMGSSAGRRGLALLRLDRIGDAMAAGQPIAAGDAVLHPLRPDWARFDWPDAAAAGTTATGT
ncbi:folate-binding protein [Microbaculum marinum]|uniref:Folate-binding protein n=1 Tax=Microbaculum marinum TaxID=1764581 RepID=A0AAW9RDL9_9HYPH